MARATSEKVGRGPCPSCGEPVMFRRSSGGMLCHKCEMCDSSGFAAPGGDAYKARIKSLTHPAPGSTSEPAAAPAKAKPVATVTTDPAPIAPAPSRKTPNSVFDLGDL